MMMAKGGVQMMANGESMTSPDSERVLPRDNDKFLGAFAGLVMMVACLAWPQASSLVRNSMSSRLSRLELGAVFRIGVG
jgi:hypothetical protein